jgi:GAF domain
LCWRSGSIVAADRRRLRILELVTATDGADISLRRLCEVAVEVTAVTGAGIMLAAGDQPRGALSSTNGVAELIEDLQYTLGEGPCVDAQEQGSAVFEADLAQAAVGRWPAFAPAAIAAGVRAIFGFPVRTGVVQMGALDLYRDRPGSLSDDEHAYALVVADLVALAILALQATVPAGDLPAEMNAPFPALVHQAAGMVSVQLDVSVGEALIRMRAHAFAAGRPLAIVAEDVVSRRLNFDDPLNE